MKKRYDELEYAYAVGRLRVLETKLLTRADYEKLLSAENVDEAAKILADLGWGYYDTWEEMIDAQTEKNFALIESMGGGVFLKTQRVKYDYHNIKVLLKAEITKTDADALLVDCGNIPAEQMKEAILNRDFRNLTKNMRQAVLEGLDQCAKLPDASLMDILIDSYSFLDMQDYADQQPDPFIAEMVRRHIDMYNIKTFVRVRNMGRDSNFLKKVLAEGGTMNMDFFLKNFLEPLDKTAGIFEGTAYAGAFSGEQDLELALDDSFIQSAVVHRQQPFGLAPLAGYFWARENEILNARIILTCKASRLPAEVIRRRLRGV